MQSNLLKRIIVGTALMSLLQIVFLSSAFAGEFSSLAAKDSGLKMIEPGNKFEDFTIKTLDDEDYKLSDKIGKKVIFMLFWSIFCQPCQEEIPVITDLYKKIGKDKMEVLAVSLDGDRRVPAIEKFIAKNKLEFTFLMDVFDDETNGFVASDTYGVLGTPTYYIIDKEGLVSTYHTGKSSLEELVEKLNDAKP